MNFSVYLFDFDYTLANSEVGIIICYRSVLLRHGHPDVSDDAIRRTIGYPVEDSFTTLCGVTDKATLQEYRREFIKEGDTHMAVNTYLYPLAVPVIKELKSRGKKIGIVSTKLNYRMAEILGKYGATSLFDIIIGAEDVKKPKPDPQGVLLAAEKLGIKKKEILYTGDSEVDALTAKNAGVSFAAVLTGTTTESDLAGLPKLMVMADLSGLL